MCVENAGRSQMAEALAKHFGRARLEPWSAGSQPSGKINPVVVELLSAWGVDMTGQRSKGLAELPELAWDYVVTMGCGDACPFVPAKARLDWQIPDPKGRSKPEIEAIARQIEEEVLRLVERAIAEGYDEG